MASEDDFHNKNPAMNKWMQADPIHQGAASDASVQAKRSATARVTMSGLVQRLALRLGVSPESLAARIPEETIRRTKFPVVERMMPDGLIEFTTPSGIIEGVRGTHLTSPRQT